jgi:hypothetical protein
LNVFDGLSDLEVVATSTNAEKILGTIFIFIFCLLIRYRFDVGVTSLFVGKCVRENELEKLKGVAMAASNKLFNLSFLATKPVYFFVLFCFGFVIFFVFFRVRRSHIKELIPCLNVSFLELRR